jgi:hypothetical protein
VTHRRKDDNSFGDSQADIREEILIISELTGPTAGHYADARCRCGAGLFKLWLDDEAKTALRTCRDCGLEHPIGNSAQPLEKADINECECDCGSQVFEITVGVALVEGTEDVTWVYVGCRCPKCESIGCYGDWEVDFKDFRKFLSMV